MKRLGSIMAIFLAMGGSVLAAQNPSPNANALAHSQSHLFSQQAIDWQTNQRIIKLTTQQVEYTYNELMNMYDAGTLTISETSEPNYYLVSIQEADGSVTEVTLLDNL